MTDRCWLLGGAVLVLSLLVFAFFTPVPAPLAYPPLLLVAALVGGLSLHLSKHGKSQRALRPGL